MINEKIILQGCKIFSKFYSQYKISNWIKVKSNIYISRVSKEQTGFMNLITRYPKFECKIEEENSNYRFVFLLLWKLKGLKNLQSVVIGVLYYDSINKSFSKFKKNDL